MRVPPLCGEVQTLRAVALRFGYKAEFVEKFIAVLLILAECWRRPNQFIGTMRHDTDIEMI